MVAVEASLDNEQDARSDAHMVVGVLAQLEPIYVDSFEH